jgi:hypothetical protein
METISTQQVIGANIFMEGYDNRIHEYVHFHSKKECDIFINYITKMGFISKMNLTIEERCCHGNGCKILNINDLQLKKIMEDFKLYNLKNDKI